MKNTTVSQEHFRRRFEQILNSYPHTISLFKKTELEEIFKELFSLWVTLSQTHKMDFLKIKMGDILLKRADSSIFNRKPCHKLYHPIFGTVFELETYKNEHPFLLTKCERYLDKIDKVLGKGYPGVGTLKKELKHGDQFKNGSFFELEADALLLSILSKPYSLKEKVVKGVNRSNVDFIGNWNKNSVKFEVKSLCHTGKIIRKGSILEIAYVIFEQARKDSISDILLKASKKFMEGYYNFVIIPDGDYQSEPIGSFESAVKGLSPGNPEIFKKIVSVITYRTDFDLKEPLNKDATLIEVGPCPPWIDSLLDVFRGTKI
jgi:hypothetical protein